MTRYQVPVANALLEQRPWLPVEGLRLVSEDGPYVRDTGPDPHTTLCTFEDDHASAYFEGKIVDLTFERSGGGFSEDEPPRPSRTVIVSRAVIGSFYGTCEHCGCPQAARKTWAADVGSSVLETYCPRCDPEP